MRFKCAWQATSSSVDLTISRCGHRQNPDEESQACQSSDAQLHGYCVRCSRGSFSEDDCLIWQMETTDLF